jgi:xanthine dehydrogenase accessory factor
MHDILSLLPELAATGQRAALCTVTDTVGSTPQKAGAKLLILPDLRNVGTLGGGCVEAEARKQAVGIMVSGARRLLSFRLDDDYGWDDGLICGGSMKVFVDLTDRPADAGVYRAMQRLLEAGVPAVLATVVEVGDDSEGVVLGQKLLLGLDGRRVGTLGAASLDDEVLSAAAKALEENRPYTWRAPRAAVSVFLEGVLPQVHVLIAGAGHVGAAVSRFAAMCDFRVTVVDDRPEYANAQNLPDAHEIIVGDIPAALADDPKGPMTFVVIVTRGHRHDEECLHAVIQSDAGYIGLIGSRRKVKLIFDDLRAMGIAEERLANVYAPIGVDIGSKTVPEIAISIVAQLIQQRNTRKVRNVADAFRAARA